MPELDPTALGGIGHFDKQGNACLKFHLCGVKHDDPGVEYTGIIDTGFTGFVHLPMQYSFALGLPLHGTVSVTLADGSNGVCLAALAKTSYGGKQQTGVVTLEANATDILVGMDFLRRFNLGLVVSKQGVWLLPEELLDKLSKEADKAKGKKQLQAEAKGKKQMQAEAKGQPVQAKSTASDSKAPRGKKRP
jgi:predicted aspartyl protease